MRSLRSHEAAVGQRVLYAGVAGTNGVDDPSRLHRGHILMHHHPGIVQKFYGPGVNHCIVAFVGLEDETVSLVAGFDHDENGHYPGLLVPSDEEWEKAVSSGWWSAQLSREELKNLLPK